MNKVTEARRIVNGRYALLPNPKAGGMADVYCATDLDNEGQKVAVKMLRYLAEQDAIIAESFRRETDALQRLDHPNIVKLIEARQDPESGRYFLVLEWLDADLGEHIKAHLCVLGLVREVRAAVLHLRDARVGVSMPEAWASRARTS